MNRTRQSEATKVRDSASELANDRPRVRHLSNGDEQKFRRLGQNIDCGQMYQSAPTYMASFTKGLQHNYESGLVECARDFQLFVKAIDSGDPKDFLATPLGPPMSPVTGKPEWKSKKGNDIDRVRAWESQGAGSTYDLQGPDAQSVTMPPAPALGSDELVAEMGEVYIQALLRDVPFSDLAAGSGGVLISRDSVNSKTPDSSIEVLYELVNELNWFTPGNTDSPPTLGVHEQARKRPTLSGQTAFRGITPGDTVGPYLSQFLLIGNDGIHPNDSEQLPSGDTRGTASGLISYGALNIDQRVRKAKAYKDHLVKWKVWYDAQNGADFRDMEGYDSDQPRRFITTPRDLATYVHYDALYEAYLNACLILLGKKTPFDPGIPFQLNDDQDHQQAFAHFGGPHILSLVTEVATRALKAVRFQKFNVHRRLRPEVLAARITKRAHRDVATPELDYMADQLKSILALIAARNPEDPNIGATNYLLPMAFCEGSPMHPSYGAGHATVAGACVTILKAFFDHKHPLVVAGDTAEKAYVPDSEGNRLDVVSVIDESGAPGSMTVEGELNKLASNISIGRDWAGVHYFSDYIESLRMGEQIAIGILEEQKLTYGENFSMTVPLFDGGAIRI